MPDVPSAAAASGGGGSGEAADGDDVYAGAWNKMNAIISSGAANQADNIQVACRLRPFNKRERDLKTPKCVTFQANQVSIKDPETPKGNPNKFSYDFVFDSSTPGGPNFVSSQRPRPRTND